MRIKYRQSAEHLNMWHNSMSFKNHISTVNVRLSNFSKISSCYLLTFVANVLWVLYTSTQSNSTIRLFQLIQLVSPLNFTASIIRTETSFRSYWCHIDSRGKRKKDMLLTCRKIAAKRVPTITAFRRINTTRRKNSNVFAGDWLQAIAFVLA